MGEQDGSVQQRLNHGLDGERCVLQAQRVVDQVSERFAHQVGGQKRNLLGLPPVRNPRHASDQQAAQVELMRDHGRFFNPALIARLAASIVENRRAWRPRTTSQVVSTTR